MPGASLLAFISVPSPDLCADALPRHFRAMRATKPQSSKYGTNASNNAMRSASCG